METKQTAAEWLEQTLAASSDHVDPVALLALAMLRDAKRELEEARTIARQQAEAHGCNCFEYGEGEWCRPRRYLEVGGWDAIERNFAEGKYK